MLRCAIVICALTLVCLFCVPLLGISKDDPLYSMKAELLARMSMMSYVHINYTNIKLPGNIFNLQPMYEGKYYFISDVQH